MSALGVLQVLVREGAGEGVAGWLGVLGVVVKALVGEEQRLSSHAPAAAAAATPLHREQSARGGVRSREVRLGKGS